MNRRKAAAALASLARRAGRYGPGLAAAKIALLETLSRSTLASASQVLRLHELLCFLDAYPDDRRVRSAARRMLAGIRHRADLMRFRPMLAGTGIAGTDTAYRFYWPTARWISRHWPGALRLDREDPDHARAILAALPELLEPAQAAWLQKLAAPSLDVLDRLRPRAMTDADFLISLVDGMPGDEFSREAFFDRVDPPFILHAGATTPQRTTERLDWLPPHFRKDPLKGPRPQLSREARRPPQRVIALDRRRAGSLIRLARISMITRERDLEAFQYASADGALLVDDGLGLGFALVGMAPERRALLPAIFGGLILQNGVPTGYVQIDVLGRHAELSFNLFETFRGGESSRVFSRLVAATRHLFGCDSFSIEPYQLGADNAEGIQSGAWWFYRRLGFRPRAAAARRVAARELKRIAGNPGQRSSSRTLLALSGSHVFFSLEPRHAARLPKKDRWLEAATAGLRRFPHAAVADRRAAATAAARRRLRPGGAFRSDGNAERMLQRWAGLVLAFTGSGRWHARERHGLRRLIGAKAGADERTYLRLLSRHDRLRRLLDC